MNILAHPGKFVKFLVSDTGLGMTPEIIDHIFEPFFTTKEMGKGTGLGLSTVHTIAKSQGGFIEVQSEVGKGTTFSIYLPASDIPHVEENSSKNNELLKGNGEIILVVDDEKSVCEVIKETLEMYNYKVITAIDGTDALSKYAIDGKDISLVITDMLMSIMDGNQLIGALRRMNSQIKIIASSGLIDKHQAGEDGESSIQGFLHKPYISDKLLLIIKDVLK